MINAGRRFSARRSAWGNGTTTTSNGTSRARSEFAVGLLIGLARPFGECRKRIVRFGRGFVEQDPFLGQPVAQGIAGLDPKLRANVARQHRLALDRDLGERGRAAGGPVHGGIIAYRLTSYNRAAEREALKRAGRR